MEHLGQMVITPYSSATAIAHARSGRLKATDFDGQSIVELALDDGSCFRWVSAFVEKLEDVPGYYAIYTEHYGVHVFAIDDIIMLSERGNQLLPKGKR